MDTSLQVIDDDILKVSNDDTRDLVLSDEGRIIFQFVFFASICSVFALFGTIANIINFIIFYKQGFTNTVNIAFCGLAISDLCCMVTLLWASICLNPLMSMGDIPWIDVEFMYLTASLPHICFCRITSNITVYITAERCICIALPLKVKEIVTPTRTILIICMIYLMNLMMYVPESTTSYIGWRFVPERNMTLLAIIFTSNRKNVEGLCFIIHSIVSMVSFFGVIIFTVILVIKLRQSSKLRAEITLGQGQSGSISARDKRTVKMIVLIAIILIVCYIPGSMIAMTVFVVGSDFNIQGRYINICVAVWSIACTFQSINSSVNIFLYYKMSSKYKQSLNDLWESCKCNGKTMK